MGAILSLSLAEQALIAVLGLHILAYVYVKNKFTVRKKYKSHKSGSVLVTGASTGIGRSVAENVAGCGFRVFAGVRKDKDAKSFDDIE